MPDSPDPLVTRYMERVVQLPAWQRRDLDLDLTFPLRSGMWFLMPKGLAIAFYLACLSRLAIRTASRAANADEHRAAQAFFAGLAQRGWNLTGRGKAAGGLMLIRHRHRDPVEALDMYRRSSIGRFVSPYSIGWEAPAVAPAPAREPAAPVHCGCTDN